MGRRRTDERCARVVLLVGPSGSGKTYLARSVGLPILALDDFYRADTDPAMPIGTDGRIDWDDPASWDGDAALDALEDLCCDEQVEVPDYSIAHNRAVGTKVVARGGATVVVDGTGRSSVGFSLSLWEVPRVRRWPFVGLAGVSTGHFPPFDRHG